MTARWKLKRIPITRRRRRMKMSGVEPLIVNGYTIIDKIGTGGQASVYKVKNDDDGKLYALKHVNINNVKTSIIKTFITNEINTLYNISHISQHRGKNNVISLKEVINRGDGNMLILTELYDGDLNELVKNHKRDREYIEEKNVWRLMIDILMALDLCYDIGVVHGDVKPANILLKGGNAVLTDFGFVYNDKSNTPKIETLLKIDDIDKCRGTYNYSAPERFLPGCVLTNKYDIWSLGVTLYFMMTFGVPFIGEDVYDVKSNIMSGRYKPIKNEIYSHDLKNIVYKMLTVDENSRPSVKDLLEMDLIKL